MILLTGASGFIGSYLLKRLIALYGRDNVIILTSAPVGEVQYILHNGYCFTDDLQKQLERVDTVIHAGAFTPKNAAQASSWEDCDSNIINTHNLLKALPGNVSRFIFLSTLDVYGNTDVITENSPIAPVSLYGHSKLYCEKLVETWAVRSDKVCQVLRIGHVYGPGEEKYEKIIPNTIKKLLNGLPMQITGTGEDIRTFIYIEDAVEAIVKSLGLTSYKGPVNIVGSHGISIKDLVITLQGIAGDSTAISYAPSDKEIRNLYFDNSKMKELLCDESYELGQGLKLEWEYMSNLK